MPQTCSESTARVPTMKHEKGQRYDLPPCSSRERGIARGRLCDMRRERKAGPGGSTNKTRPLGPEGHHFSETVRAPAVLNGHYTREDPLTTAVGFDSLSLRQFYTLSSRRIQG